MSDATSTAALRLSRSGPSATAHAPPPLPAAAHVLYALWVVVLLLAGTLAPARYEALLQEDRFIEWWTVALFGAAGCYALRSAWRERRPFDALIGAFCIFVAGEEFSWGQRLLGITPPAPFLEHNFQQELTLHNFADIFGQPKWVLVLALAGYGLLLPLLARTARGRPLLDRIGATAPSAAAAPWFAAAVLLLVWYPLSYTGEWVETLAGGLFLATLAPAPRSAAVAGAAGALLAIALTGWSARGTASAAEIGCARRGRRAPRRPGVRHCRDGSPGGRVVRAQARVHRRARGIHRCCRPHAVQRRRVSCRCLGRAAATACRRPVGDCLLDRGRPRRGQHRTARLLVRTQPSPRRQFHSWCR